MFLLYMFQIFSQKFYLFCNFLSFFPVGGVGSSLLLGLSLATASRSWSSLQHTGLFWGVQAIGTRTSAAAVPRLWRMGSVVWQAGLIAPRPWEPPGPGIRPVSHPLAGRFLTIEPPGKPLQIFFLKFYL